MSDVNPTIPAFDKPHKMKYGYFLTVGQDPQQRLLAICADGSPQKGHKHVTVLSVALVETEDDAKVWFRRMVSERPWNRPTIH